VRGSSLNCYSFDPSASDGLETRVSLVTQQYKFGNADTCELVLQRAIKVASAWVLTKALMIQG